MRAARLRGSIAFLPGGCSIIRCSIGGRGTVASPSASTARLNLLPSYRSNFASRASTRTFGFGIVRNRRNNYEFQITNYEVILRHCEEGLATEESRTRRSNPLLRTRDCFDERI